MNCIKERIIFSIIIFVLFSLSVSAQEIGDPLLDVPIPDDVAINEAQGGIQSSQEPKESNLQMYPVKTETGNIENRLVWNVTFGEPENKEVIVDAKTGTVLSVIEKKENITLGITRYPIFLIIIGIVVLMCIFLIISIKIRKRTSADQEIETSHDQD